MEELQCNIVVMKRSQPKVLRLNLVGSPAKEPDVMTSENQESKADVSVNSARGPDVTPSSSPETFTTTEAGTSSVSSSDPGTSPFFVLEKRDMLSKKDNALEMKKQDQELDESSSDSDNESLSSSSLRFRPWMAAQSLDRAHNSANKAVLEKLSRFDDESGYGSPINGNLRDMISLSRTGPLGPPPLCSICQHKAPEFGKPPKWFTYAELELATGGFSQANFLAEGGFGSVHRGLLPGGQAIAVKQHKLASSQGDQEFCSEVEVLSCAQHRNVVTLIGFCIEDGRRLLVYEYICNRSLHSHLYGIVICFPKSRFLTFRLYCMVMNTLLQEGIRILYHGLHVTKSRLGQHVDCDIFTKNAESAALCIETCGPTTFSLPMILSPWYDNQPAFVTNIGFLQFHTSFDLNANTFL